ncbi:hypothetical protein BDZ91DRAFT_794129 [Kalaharituber pfeilii]|nr:hypothetical protein BDZ91DRAFT_794129 [Kalaharituber pfeilii]
MFRKKKESSQQPSVPERKRDMFLRPFRRDSRSRSPSHSPRIPGSPAPEQQVSQSPHGEAGEGEQGTQQCNPRIPPSQQQHAETSTLPQIDSDLRQENLNSLVPHADKENHTAHHEPRHNLPTELAEQQQNKISVNLWVEAHKRLLETSW